MAAAKDASVDVDAALAAISALSSELQSTATKLVGARSKDDGGADTSPGSVLSKATSEAAVLSVALKMQERRALLATEACKVQVEDDKKALDQHHLQLQNLLYERNHLLREIERCRSFRCVTYPSRAVPPSDTRCRRLHTPHPFMHPPLLSMRGVLRAVVLGRAWWCAQHAAPGRCGPGASGGVQGNGACRPAWGRFHRRAWVVPEPPAV